MIRIEPLSPHIAAEFKAVRLSALQDTPTAFGSTFAQESQLSEMEWLRRVSAWHSERSACYIAMEEHLPCGIAAGKCDARQPQRAWLLSMWVAPSHRRSGLGIRLVRAVELWAREAGVTELLLMVTSANPAAMRFYERCGFALTGNTSAYPNDPAIFEYEMAKLLSPS
jgi:GNAT superfamily N-acetyltransferase